MSVPATVDVLPANVGSCIVVAGLQSAPAAAQQVANSVVFAAQGR